MTKLPSLEELKARLEYNPNTGVFIWKTGRNRGKRAGSLNKYLGYRQIGLRRRQLVYEHRLAFLYMTGQVPVEIDHVDRCRANNQWSNLRVATRLEQAGNVGMFRHNTSGIKGVYQIPLGSWRVRIGGKHVGCFATPDEARAAYEKAARLKFGKFYSEIGGSNS